jgi:type II secretory pathway pseudopilin PulG
MTHHHADERGFSLVEMLVILGIAGVLAGVAVGVSTTIVRVARADSGAQQLDAFLKRHRELAIARRRDIEIVFEPPNRVMSFERAVPNPPDPTPAPTPLETMVFEGGIVYRLTTDVPDTPNLFGNGEAIAIGGPEPVMLAPEGSLLDALGNPVNVTISLGVEGDPLSATAVTILGATASIERWRWNGRNWTR